MDRRRFLAAPLAVGALLPQPRHALASAGPSGEGVLRFIISSGPGDLGDRVTRFITDRLGDTLGMPAVVDNRPGADTVLAVQALLAAPADGRSVLFVTSTTLVFNPLLRQDLPYDPKRDLIPVAGSSRTPVSLLVRADSPIQSLADLIAAARRRPGEISVGSSAQSFRVVTAMLAHEAGVRFNFIPYRTMSQVLNDIGAGVTDVAIVTVGTARQFVSTGRGRVLASTGHARSALMPEVPTVAESGFRDFHFHAWQGYAVHGQTPEPTARRVEDLLARAVGHPDFRRFVETEAGAEWVGARRQPFAAMLEADTQRFRRALAEAG